MGYLEDLFGPGEVLQTMLTHAQKGDVPEVAVIGLRCRLRNEYLAAVANRHQPGAPVQSLTEVVVAPTLRLPHMQRHAYPENLSADAKSPEGQLAFNGCGDPIGPIRKDSCERITGLGENSATMSIDRGKKDLVVMG